MQQEHGQQQSVDNVAVETERFLALMRARMTMHSAEAIAYQSGTKHTNPMLGEKKISYLGAFIPISCRRKCSLTAMKALLCARSARLLLEIRNGDCVMPDILTAPNFLYTEYMISFSFSFYS